MRDGKLEDALALYRQTPPDSLPANIAAGSILDLMGRGDEARKYFQKATDTTDTPEHKAMAQRAMAMSYAFEGNCKKTVENEQQVLDYYASAKDFFRQGEIADEAARVCIDSGDLDTAYKWYQLGHDLGLKEPDIKAARVDLWNFRWEHAQARIAAGRGNQAEAQKHVAAAKAILDKGTNPEQAPFFPYLVGFVAFYSGDYKRALDELLKANQNDPFIQCMIAQTYERLGEKDKAVEFYRKAAAAIFHNPTAAYVVPFSKKKLSSRRSRFFCLLKRQAHSPPCNRPNTRASISDISRMPAPRTSMCWVLRRLKLLTRQTSRYVSAAPAALEDTALQASHCRVPRFSAHWPAISQFRFVIPRDSPAC
jgi:tetratricopeptide (TPR) repeat protein